MIPKTNNSLETSEAQRRGGQSELLNDREAKRSVILLNNVPICNPDMFAFHILGVKIF